MNDLEVAGPVLGVTGRPLGIRVVGGSRKDERPFLPLTIDEPSSSAVATCSRSEAESIRSQSSSSVLYLTDCLLPKAIQG